MSTGRILNIPNILTLARIAFIPVFLVIAYWPPAIGIAEHHGGMMRHLILTAIFVLAAVTDWFDGYLARTLNQTSAFGRFLDPVADKLMVAAALVLIAVDMQTLWVTVPAFLMISREIIISGLREWMAGVGRGAQVKVSDMGKWKTAVQMLALIGLIWQPVEWITQLGMLLLYLATLLTVWSMVAYLQAAWQDLKQ